MAIFFAVCVMCTAEGRLYAAAPNSVWRDAMVCNAFAQASAADTIASPAVGSGWNPYTESSYICSQDTEVCAFQNVCVRSADMRALPAHLPNALYPWVAPYAGRFVIIEHWAPTSRLHSTVYKPTIHRLGSVSCGSSAHVPAVVCAMNGSPSNVTPDALHFRDGVHVLASYYGAENFGHHVLDNWNIFYKLLRSAKLTQFSSSPDANPAHLLLARDCDAFNYIEFFSGAFLGGTGDDGLKLDCRKHESRFESVSGFDTVSTPSSERTCYKNLIAGGGKFGRPGPFQPLETLWDFRNGVYARLGIAADEGPLTSGVLVLVKMSTVVRFPVHASLDNAERLATFLRGATRLHVDVLPLPGPEASISSQVHLMRNYSHVILPGGGGGFIGMLAAYGGHVLVAAYDFEKMSFERPTCYARVTTISLHDRDFDHAHILQAIESPPPLATCDMDAYTHNLRHQFDWW